MQLWTQRDGSTDEAIAAAERTIWPAPELLDQIRNEMPDRYPFSLDEAQRILIAANRCPQCGRPYGAGHIAGLHSFA